MHGGVSHVGIGTGGPAVAPDRVEGPGAFVDESVFREGWKTEKWKGSSVQIQLVLDRASGEGERCRDCARQSAQGKDG